MENPKHIDVTPEQLNDLLTRLESTLNKEDFDLVKAMAETILYLNRAVDDKSVSIKRLLRTLFGGNTEKTKKVMKELEKSRVSDKSSDQTEEGETQSPKKKPKGHGRNSYKKYKDAKVVRIDLEGFVPGGACPECKKGKLYEISEPSALVRVTGQAPIHATVYELQKCRCNLCGLSFKADPPEGVSDKKYDANSGAIIALLKYGCGFPFERLENLQANLGIPLPASTQWDIVNSLVNEINPVFNELISQAAQGNIIHNDDTVMKILALIEENEKLKAKARNSGKKKSKKPRTGMFTSGIVSVFDDKKAALFFTGRNHAGENLEEVLKKRKAGLSPPIQMCDALSRNASKEFKTLLANCLAHGRRQFVDIAENFPEECMYVLKILKKIYENDNAAKERKMSPEERLVFHQENSKSLMDKLHDWCVDQLKNKKTEPNSSLGKSIKYMLSHWKKLTLFLNESGAPIDNNLCERALKKAILNRKNSLFYKTERGAYVGDLFMSLIHTCSLCKKNPFDYLAKLQTHIGKVLMNPQDWMPWNYEATLSSISFEAQEA